MIYNQSDGRYSNSGTITDGVVIDGSNIVVTNTDSGRIVGGVRFAQGGGTFVNELGGQVRADGNGAPEQSVAIVGSSGDDTVVNAGFVAGAINLGAGNDRLTDRDAQSFGIDLGDGDDVYRAEGSSYRFLRANGGNGDDRVIVATTNGIVDGGGLTGFEHVTFETARNLLNFSGFTTITLSAATTEGYNFVTSANPAVDLALQGQSVTLSSSSLRSVTGSAQVDRLDLSQGSSVSGDVRLGGGDDSLSFRRYGDGALGTVGGVADGGSGFDMVEYYAATNGTVTSVDLTRVTGFEQVLFNWGYTIAATWNARAIGSDVREILVGQKASLTIADSLLSNATVLSSFGGTLTLASGSTLARLGPTGTFSWSNDIAQGDTALSSVAIINGTVLGDVRMYIGDDLVDARLGSVGGTIFGNAGNDTLLGGAGGDRIEGGYGADRIEGNGGNDILDGGPGNDTLDGGAGDDRFIVDSSGDVVIEAAGNGYDTVVTGVSYALGAAVSVEALAAVGGQAAIILVGNGFAQTLTGNDGANLLNGNGGADTLIGGRGDDTYAIADANAVIVEATGEGRDTVFSSVSYTLTSTAEIETLSVTSQRGSEAINLIGNQFAQQVVGNFGENVLNGNGGADTLIGLKGNDIYAVADPNAVIVEAEGEGIDTVFSQASYTLTSTAEIETLSLATQRGTGAFNLIGNQYSQQIVGNFGDNVLNGNGGVDTLTGLKGDDTYVVGDARSQVLENAGEGNDTVFTSVSYALAAGTSIEVLSTQTQGATAAINLTGNEIAQTVIGNYGANVIDGGAGADTLYGLQGADTFRFSTALGGGNVDRIADFESGIDRIALSSSVFGGLATGSLSASAFTVGTAATSANQRIVYDQTTGQLFYDADGSGAGAAMLFATVTPGTVITAAMITVA